MNVVEFQMTFQIIITFALSLSWKCDTCVKLGNHITFIFGGGGDYVEGERRKQGGCGGGQTRK